MTGDPGSVVEETGAGSCGWCGGATVPGALVCPHCGTELTVGVTVRPGRRAPVVRPGPTFDGQPLPDLGVRWWGRFVDGIVVFLPLALLEPLAFHNHIAGRSIVVVVAAIYEGVCVALWGRTLGKRVARTRVVSIDPRRPVPSPWQALVRAAVVALPSLFYFVPPPAGSVLADLALLAIWVPLLRQRQRRAVPDLLAGTIVVNARAQTGTAGHQEMMWPEG